MLISAIQRLARRADDGLARVSLYCRRERPSVRCFLFHSLFRDEAEIASGTVDPLERTTLEHFRRFVRYFLEQGYRFITPRDLLGGDLVPGHYAMITFDDGYFSSTLALPVLRSLGACATFFISTEQVRRGRCFWWDVLYRNRLAMGRSPAAIQHETLALKDLTTEQIESQLTAEFGESAFLPRGDIDRPLTVAELKDLASNPEVEIGNHTANHAILTNYPAQQVFEQIQSAADTLESWLGLRPGSIAYPNGAVNGTVISAARSAGMSIGFTTRPNKWNIEHARSPEDAMQLGRFCLASDSRFLEHCRTARSDYLIYPWLRNCYVAACPGAGRA